MGWRGAQMRKYDTNARCQKKEYHELNALQIL